VTPDTNNMNRKAKFVHERNVEVPVSLKKCVQVWALEL